MKGAPLVLVVIAVSVALLVSGRAASAPSNSCYQESANVSTSCGGLSSGAYGATNCDLGRGTCDNDLFASAYLCVDGSYEKPCAELQGGDSNRTMDLWINYTKPSFAGMDSRWQVYGSDGSGPRYANLSIPLGCFAQQPLQFRYTAWSFWHEGQCFEMGAQYSCFNGSAWQPLPDAGVGRARCGTTRSAMYEEGMWWS